MAFNLRVDSLSGNANNRYWVPFNEPRPGEPSEAFLRRGHGSNWTYPRPRPRRARFHSLPATYASMTLLDAGPPTTLPSCTRVRAGAFHRVSSNLVPRMRDRRLGDRKVTSTTGPRPPRFAPVRFRALVLLFSGLAPTRRVQAEGGGAGDRVERIAR